MAEEAARSRQYEYRANSNLVLTAERDKRRDASEPTGEVESLQGRIVYRMGDKSGQGRAPELEDKMKKAKAKRERMATEAKAGEKEQAKKAKVFKAGKGSSVMTETEDGDSINYRPKTRESKAAYEQILSVVQLCVGDQPQDVLRGAADEVLALLKDDALRDPERHAEVGKLVGKVSPEQFNKLIVCGRQITDFGQAAGAGDGDGGEGVEDADDEKLDEEMGVAVVFDDESDEEGGEGDDDDDEVRDEDDEDGEGEGGVEAMASSKLAKGADSDDEGGGGDGSGDGSTLNVKDVDAHWLQRSLSAFYADATESATKADEVLGLLAQADERVCENDLLVLLDYERFELIRVLLKNRAKILFCTKLKQAQTDEAREAIEQEMLADPSGAGSAILQQLSQVATAESWVSDRMADFRTKSLKEAQQLKSMHADADALAAAGGGAGAGGNELRGAKALLSGGRGDVDLDALTFAEGGHHMSNKRCELPDKSWRASKKGYEEVHVPAAVHQPLPGEVLVQIHGAAGDPNAMPEWTRPAFEGMHALNRIQSRMKAVALETNENLLLCAPTGAGKTNVAVMCMLNVLAQHVKPDGNGFDLDAFKIVYVAPMKALVQECVLNFQRRLEPFGIQVKELSGDQSLTRQQIKDTHVIVTTPEKWDIVTRKSGERTYTQLVRLLIIDEIHLLHDSRGPVLESIVARTVRQVETTQEMVRVVGLSATLPNYADVAAFLRVDPELGLFFFDNSFRPVPLQQQYIGITEKKAMKRFALMNEICYEKVLACAGRHQVLIFCHSRAETAKTATALRDLCVEHQTIGQFIAPESATSEILKEEAASASNPDLKELLEYGFAIHHAGMTRADRNSVEDLFASKHVQVLCSTSTLAWGVNLPAHTVIIKGTQMYSPEKGRWVELSPLDIMQMLGRAGRPGFDTEGEGIILTQHSELQFYLSLMNQQLPIESQLVAKLPDMLNAEVVLGGVGTLRDAADWLGYTYLHVRMLQSPETYGVTADELARDPQLLQRRLDLAHAAAIALDRSKLVKYDRRTGQLQAQALGRVASHYYVGHASMATYNEYLKPTMSDIELFRLFSLSAEFQFIHVREEEKLELAKLAARVPVPIKEAVDEPSAKVNVLLQAYISNLKLEGFALVADLTFIRQSAARLTRCLLDIAQRRGWAALVHKCLALCQMVERRMWLSQSPLRQFKQLPEKIARMLERKDIPWERYYDLKPADLGELVKLPKMGKPLHALVHKFPRLELAAHVQPVTRSLLKVELTITPDFEFDPKVHDSALLFHVLVEDVDGETVLHQEPFVLKEAYASEEHVVNFTVPLFDPLPPQYFLRVVSDRWLHADASLPISFRNLVMPHRFPPPTELLDLQPLPVSHLKQPKVETALFGHINAAAAAAASGGSSKGGFFNPVQTQCFTQLYETDDNVLVCAPAGSGKTACAEFAVLRMLRAPLASQDAPPPKGVYVCAQPAVCDATFADWSRKFGEGLGVAVAQLCGEQAADLKALQGATLVVATAEQWDMVSRRWKQRKAVQEVKLLVVDELHLVGGGGQGPTLEVIVSRTRYIASQLESAAAAAAAASATDASGQGKCGARIVGLSASLANAKDVGDWVGAAGHGLFAFHPQVRPVPLEVKLSGFEVAHFGARMVAMGKPAFVAAANHVTGDGAAASAPVSGAQSPADASVAMARAPCVVVYVPSRKQAQLTAIDLATYAAASGDSLLFLGGASPDAKAAVAAQLETVLASAGEIADPALVSTLPKGVAFVHGGMPAAERSRVLALAADGVARVLVVPYGLAWQVHCRASLVVVLDTVAYDGREHRYVDYPIADLLHMVGRAGRPSVDARGVALVQCHGPKVDALQRLLLEPLPVESHLDHFLHDHLNAEVVTRTVENKQDAVDYMTWTLYWPRLAHNPNYYNLQGTTHRHLSDHLSELVEGVITDLEESRALAVEDDMHLAPLNLGMIAAYYYIAYTTVELFASSLTDKTKLRGLLEIVCAASEYGELPVRHHEAALLQSLAHHLPQKLPDSAKFSDPHTKALVLLQAHFSRHPLASELASDQAAVLGHSLKLLQALVDVISSNGWLKPAIVAMECSQMIVQGLWDKDHPLLQLPHVNKDTLSRCQAAHNARLPQDGSGDVETVFDVMALEDDVRDDLLRLTAAQTQDVAAFCNAYPNVELSFEVVDADQVETGDAVSVVVTLEREVDEDEDDSGAAAGAGATVVYAPKYPKPKHEGWWLVVGNAKTNALLCVKRVSLAQKATVKLDFVAPDEPGDYALTLYFMCDSYIGCDQEYALELKVAQGDSDEDDDDEGEEKDLEEEEASGDEGAGMKD